MKRKTKNKKMEDKLMKGLGFGEIDSSELQIRGGASSPLWQKIIDKVRNMIDFIGDYIPKLLQGFRDGFEAKPLIK